MKLFIWITTILTHKIISKLFILATCISCLLIKENAGTIFHCYPTMFKIVSYSFYILIAVCAMPFLYIILSTIYMKIRYWKNTAIQLDKAQQKYNSTLLGKSVNFCLKNIFSSFWIGYWGLAIIICFKTDGRFFIFSLLTLLTSDLIEMVINYYKRIKNKNTNLN